MAKLIALDVAILPPPDVSARAIAASDALAQGDESGPRLDAGHLPHITLSQQFVREEELDEFTAAVQVYCAIDHRDHGPEEKHHVG